MPQVCLQFATSNSANHQRGPHGCTRAPEPRRQRHTFTRLRPAPGASRAGSGLYGCLQRRSRPTAYRGPPTSPGPALPTDSTPPLSGMVPPARAPRPPHAARPRAPARSSSSQPEPDVLEPPLCRGTPGALPPLPHNAGLRPPAPSPAKLPPHPLPASRCNADTAAIFPPPSRRAVSGGRRVRRCGGAGGGSPAPAPGSPEASWAVSACAAVA